MTTRNRVTCVSLFLLLGGTLLSASTPGAAGKMGAISDPAAQPPACPLVRFPSPMGAWEIVGRLPVPGDGVQIVALGSQVYVAQGASRSPGVLIVDLSDPTAPTDVSRWESPALGLAVAPPYLWLHDRRNVGVWDISDQANPDLISVFSFPGEPDVESIAVDSDYAYVSTRDGLRILDASSLPDIHDVALYGLPPEAARAGSPFSRQVWPQEVKLANSYAYVAANDGGLRVLDVTSPDSPTELSAYHAECLTERGSRLSSPVSGVVIDGGRAYLKVDPVGLHILDVSDPVHPSLVGSGSVPSPGVWAMAVGSRYVYFTDIVRGVHVLDVADPASPRVVGFYRSGPAGVAVVGEHLVVAEPGALLVLRFSPDE